MGTSSRPRTIKAAPTSSRGPWFKLTRVDALHDFDTAPFAQFAVGQGGPVEWVGTSLIGKTVAFEALDFVSR